MKRKSIWIILSVIILLILLLVVLPMYYFANIENRAMKKEFEEKKDSFIALAELFNEIYKEYDVDEIRIRVDIKQDKYIFKISDGTERKYVEVDSDMISYVEDVDEAFLDYGWDKTVVTKDAVSFSNEGNWYAFIYTNDGEKPEYMNFPTETFEIKVKYLGDNCYFVKSK